MNYRRKLAELCGNRETFTATFEREGVRSGYNGPTYATALLTNVQLNGKSVAQHVWVDQTFEFSELHLSKGDIIEFSALVMAYRKMYDSEVNYTLTELKNIKKQ